MLLVTIAVALELVGHAAESGLTLEALDASFSKGWFGDSRVVALFLVSALLILLPLIGLWGAWYRRREINPELAGITPTATNLFLAVDFHSLGDTRNEMGYLRVLGPREVHLVVARHFERGSQLIISLGAVPGFADDSLPLTARVLSCRGLGGEAPSFLVRAKFEPLSNQHRLALNAFLFSLVGKRGIASRKI